MESIKIREPLWKNRSIGVAEYRMSEPTIKIEIIYKEKSGKRLYPGVYTISREKAMTYPIQTLPSGTILRIIPISDLERVEEKK